MFVQTQTESDNYMCSVMLSLLNPVQPQKLTQSKGLAQLCLHSKPIVSMYKLEIWDTATIIQGL